MRSTTWYPRALLLGFVAIFVIGGGHVLLEALGLWPMLPAVVVHAIDFVTGLILVMELLGHLAILTWKPGPVS